MAGVLTITYENRYARQVSSLVAPCFQRTNYKQLSQGRCCQSCSRATPLPLKCGVRGSQTPQSSREHVGMFAKSTAATIEIKATKKNHAVVNSPGSVLHTHTDVQN